MNTDEDRRTFVCRLACLGFAALVASSGSAEQLTLEIKDYATMPMTGMVDGTTNIALLARINSMREEPGGTNRLFIVDMNGPLYILDKKTNKTSVYLDFNGREGRRGLFHRIAPEAGLSQGFVGVQFDPDYAKNGKFYTIHVEDPTLPGSPLPDDTNFPGLKIPGYTLTKAIPTPGVPPVREGVVIEWTDSNISNTTFEGSAREIMRIQQTRAQHPLGEMIFNPLARPGDADWRVMYLSCGDGGSGESKDATTRQDPQRLDNMVGKIHRIIPDLNEHTKSSTVSENGRYRIPNDNPFVNAAGARKEIWAYGMRNPNRLSWDVDPADRSSHLIADVIGLSTWETVIIVHKGANYGYSLREGNQQLNADNKTSPLPEVDKIPIQIDETTTVGSVVPTYPVIQYGHVPGGGDAVTSGFVYRGKALPALRGKYVFGDITTGHIWWADFKEMLAADDGDPKTMAQIHEIPILWAKPDGSKEIYATMFPITLAAYHARGGKKDTLPGFAKVAGGRADIRFAMDAAGELYILSRSDGMIRAVVGAH
jgi:hypothetical protein